MISRSRSPASMTQLQLQETPPDATSRGGPKIWSFESTSPMGQDSAEEPLPRLNDKCQSARLCYTRFRRSRQPLNARTLYSFTTSRQLSTDAPTVESLKTLKPGPCPHPAVSGPASTLGPCYFHGSLRARRRKSQLTTPRIASSWARSGSPISDGSPGFVSTLASSACASPGVDF